ncbi:hypothetical protein AAU57_06695 [Nonlabens sp. YIK11]|uniref:hypothetical protein n=1 Tax=Nonlabens sp. YIK11 TaxID=1453349 RepID=UPI0006DD0E03|nr:hypothetical protein [Nonlabens sp. YIK11]KQC33042.1 hypothetical protein AAU57_06695 [Nonlabens sp. YIK11]
MKTLISLILFMTSTVLFSQGIGINTAFPEATLHVKGDFKFVPKTTNATRLIGVVANGEVKEMDMGTTFHITNNTLNVSPSIDPNVYLVGDVDQSATANSISQYDNYDIGLAGSNRNKTIIRFTGETNGYNVTGFTDGYDGRIIYFYNSQNTNVTFFDVNNASDDANQIITGSGANEGINGEGVAEFIYDGVIKKWILVNIRS